jgi:hypothetical protein
MRTLLLTTAALAALVMIAPIGTAHAADWWTTNSTREPGTVLCDRSSMSPAEVFELAQLAGSGDPHLTDNGDEVLFQDDPIKRSFYRNEAACRVAAKRMNDAGRAAAADQDKKLERFR